MRKHEDSQGGVTGWTASLSDGSTVAESEGAYWGDVKETVVALSLRHKGVNVILPSGQKRYVQGHSGTCGLAGGGIRVESRGIGFETPSGDEVFIRLSESGGEVRVEVRKCCRP